ITEVFEIIQKRISFLGLAEHKIFLNDSKIEILSLSNESIEKILERGEFEAKILRRILLANSSGTFSLISSYPVKVEDKRLLIENESYGENEKFKIENIEFRVLNITNESVFLEGFFFDNKDVKTVYLQLSYVSYNPDFKQYEFRVPVEISREASLRFGALTANAGRKFVPGGFVLDADLLYYLDGKLISELPLPVQMAGSRIENIAILGYSSKTEAIEKINSIKLALQTGMLPELEIERIEKIEAKLKNAKEMIFLGIGAFFLLNLSISFKKYGKKGFWLACFLVCEGLIILGLASLSQIFLKPGWIFDFYSILGFFVFLALSSLSYFLISEEVLKNKKFEIKISFKKIEATNLIKILSLIFSFLILFTPMKGFGLSLLSGMILSFLTNSIYKEKIKV
ncbi:MAG: hypothetical protein QW140_01210, partial [Candidatus Aenigmatarchaeota archaeon]